MDAELTTGIPARSLPLPLRLLSDERLARMVGTGHEEAFSILYERHHQALYRYCRSLVGIEADAQDALQSAMTSALVALRVSRRDAPIRPWLFRIAYNESMTQLRKRRPLCELIEELPGLDDSPEAAVEQRTRISRLLADLRELPERQRGALVMRELSGLTHQEVADAFGMSVGAAKQTVFEARRSLQEFDEGRSMACEDIRRLVSDGDGRSLRGRRVRAHLRDCAGCSAFAAAIPQRRADLHAVAPALPATAAAGLLWKITGAGSGHGGGGGVGLIGGAAGKVVAAGATGKMIATGALIVATAAVGTGGIVNAVTGGGASNPAAISHSPGSGASGSAAAAGSVKHSGLQGTSGRVAGTMRAHHVAAVAAGHGRNAGRGHRGAAGQTHSHHGSGRGVSGSGPAPAKHLGGAKNPSHGLSGTTKSSHPTRSGPAPSRASGFKRTTRRRLRTRKHHRVRAHRGGAGLAGAAQGAAGNAGSTVGTATGTVTQTPPPASSGG